MMQLCLICWQYESWATSTPMHATSAIMSSPKPLIWKSIIWLVNMQVKNRHGSVGAHNVQLHIQRKVSSGDIMVKRVIVGRDTLQLPSGGRIEDALNMIYTSQIEVLETDTWKNAIGRNGCGSASVKKLWHTRQIVKVLKRSQIPKNTECITCSDDKNDCDYSMLKTKTGKELSGNNLKRIGKMSWGIIGETRVVGGLLSVFHAIVIFQPI